MPPDPFYDDAQEARLRLSINAVDRRVALGETTWYEYLAQTVDQTRDTAKPSHLLDDKLEELEGWLPEIARTEGLDQTESQEKFDNLKMAVAKDIADAMMIVRCGMVDY